MAHFPNTFAEELTPLHPDLPGLDEQGRQALAALAAKGFTLSAGIRRQDVPGIQRLAAEPGVREFCPGDLGTPEEPGRFSNEEAVERWLQKDGGRGALLLQKASGLAGLFWLGSKKDEHIPGGETTLAARVSKAYAGQRLCELGTIATVSLAKPVYGAGEVTLETWGSNGGAVISYLRAGAELVTTEDSWRPTLSPAPNETDSMRRDIRQFMRFARTFTQRIVTIPTQTSIKTASEN